MDIGDIARALENWQQIDDSSSSGIEDITAEIMAERGLFGHFLIANSLNETMERDIEEAKENTTMTDGRMSHRIFYHPIRFISKVGKYKVAKYEVLYKVSLLPNIRFAGDFQLL